MDNNYGLFSNIPLELYDNILQFLPEQDLLNVSLVSKEFHNAVFNSSVHMSKISIRMNVRNIRKLEISALMSSKRKYQNMKISSIDIDSINDKDYSWFRFVTCEILKRFSSSLIYIESDIDLEKFNVEIPNLKKLKFVNVPYKMLELSPTGLLSKLTKINELSLVYTMTWRSKVILLDYFKMNSNLEILNINESSLETDFKLPYFNQELHPIDYKIKLKKFSLTRCFWKSENYWQIIINFLKSQSSTLKFLKIDSCSLMTFKSIVEELPKLKTFEGNFYEISNEAAVKIPRNSRIEIFKSRSILKYEEKLANSLIGLKVLKIFQLNYLSLDKIMSLHWPSLVRVEFCYYLGGFMEETDFEESFDLLLEIHPRFNKNIQFVQIPKCEQQNFF
ncbi:hypothetical protein PVAND_006377 [Polypedilum vanderplanki]|uniref:F-box domain-containing protein n=1 Tax=Polypedilum vanderplanki TaxID=319348 RepID=A0A9J6C3W1_POLVA|nr:hypothetical protein PVAND_006377 [Polypedilum vanderplanki]